jgi:hypothetical protein
VIVGAIVKEGRVSRVQRQGAVIGGNRIFRRSSWTSVVPRSSQASAEIGPQTERSVETLERVTRPAKLQERDAAIAPAVRIIRHQRQRAIVARHSVSGAPNASNALARLFQASGRLGLTAKTLS